MQILEMMAHRCVLNKTFLLVDFIFPIQIMRRYLRGLNLCRVYWKDGLCVITINYGFKDLCGSTLSADMSTDSRPKCRRTVGRYSVGISADCWSTYRPRVSTDTRSTEVFITNAPKKLRASMEMSSYVSVKQNRQAKKVCCMHFIALYFFFLGFWR